jgi:hypothetical protein
MRRFPCFPTGNEHYAIVLRVKINLRWGAHLGSLVVAQLQRSVFGFRESPEFNLLISYPIGRLRSIARKPLDPIQYLSASETVLATQPYPFAISLH